VNEAGLTAHALAKAGGHAAVVDLLKPPKKGGGCTLL
jgi:hypothetical protein